MEYINKLEQIYHEIYVRNADTDFPESLDCAGKLNDYINYLELGKKESLIIDELSGDCMAAFEKQGFLSGFCYALKLLAN